LHDDSPFDLRIKGIKALVYIEKVFMKFNWEASTSMSFSAVKVSGFIGN